jgi:hypothetical protein
MRGNMKVVLTASVMLMNLAIFDELRVRLCYTMDDLEGCESGVVFSKSFEWEHVVFLE